jgi:ATP-dependent DNA helicase RecG
MIAALFALVATAPLSALPPEPADVSAVDRPGDGGAAVFVRWRVPAPDETARVIADRVLRDDPLLEQPVHHGIRHQLTVGYARALELFQIG